MTVSEADSIQESFVRDIEQLWEGHPLLQWPRVMHVCLHPYRVFELEAAASRSHWHAMHSLFDERQGGTPMMNLAFTKVVVHEAPYTMDESDPPRLLVQREDVFADTGAGLSTAHTVLRDGEHGRVLVRNGARLRYVKEQCAVRMHLLHDWTRDLTPMAKKQHSYPSVSPVYSMTL